MKNRTLRTWALIGFIIGLVVTLSACTSNGTKSNNSAQKQAVAVANKRQNYVPVNDVEGKNYNKREQLADNPSTIIWCTAFPTNPNAPLFTVPIVGKLTSSSKRPYATSQAERGSDNTTYTPELPGPDGMYGASVEYRYGFRPDGTYVDFTGLETFCSNQPTVFQRQKTIIDLSNDPSLTAANKAASDALKAGDPAKAQQILTGSVGK